YCAPDTARWAALRAGAAALGDHAAAGLDGAATSARPPALSLVWRRWISLVPRSWLALLWLCARQGRRPIVLSGFLCFALGIALPKWPLLIWPIGTMLLGLACGLAVFGYERGGGYERFLGAQRLSPGVLWEVKTLFWLCIALAGAALMWLTGVSHQALIDANDLPNNGQIRTGVDHWEGGAVLVRGNNFPVFLGLLVIHGFAVGMVYGLVAKRVIVALILGTATAGMVLALWLPSLICGGLSLWQVLLFPVVTIIAVRLVLWRWLSERLYGLRPLAILLGC